MKRKILLFSFLVIMGTILLVACSDMTKKQEQEQQMKEDILNGKVGKEAANSDLKGAVFVDGDKTHHQIVFSKDSNSCHLKCYSSGNFFCSKPIIAAYPAAEYTVKDGKITLNFKQYSEAMAKITEKEVLAMYQKAVYTELKQKGFPEADFDKLWEDHLKKVQDAFKKDLREAIIKPHHDGFVKLYSEYQKVPPLEGELSADKKTITFKNFTIPGYNKIERYENVVFTRQ